MLLTILIFISFRCCYRISFLFHCSFPYVKDFFKTLTNFFCKSNKQSLCRLVCTLVVFSSYFPVLLQIVSSPYLVKFSKMFSFKSSISSIMCLGHNLFIEACIIAEIEAAIFWLHLLKYLKSQSIFCHFTCANVNQSQKRGFSISESERSNYCFNIDWFRETKQMDSHKCVHSILQQKS